MIERPVFLVGSERSGTTLLRLMLDHHPQIAFEKEFDFVVTKVSDTGEPPALPDYLDWLATVRGVDYSIDPAVGYPELVDDFLRQKQAASGGKPLVGATVHRDFDRLRFLWPDARYVHLVRDPRDVARSVVQKGWAGSVYQGAEFWLDAEHCWESLRGHLSAGLAFELRYEELVADTEAVLGRLCRFLAVAYSPRMLDYPLDAPQYPPPDAGLIAQWRTKLPPRDVALVELRTAGLFESRGYAPSGYPLPRVGRLRHRLLLDRARLRRVRARADTFGSSVVALDMLARHLGLRRLAARAQRRINAIEQELVDQERTGERAPSSNIAPRSSRGPLTR